MPRFLSVLGVQLLRSVPLRQAANKVRHTAAGHASAAMPCLARLPPRPGSQSTSVVCVGLLSALPALPACLAVPHFPAHLSATAPAPAHLSCCADGVL
jgi:hypothetical protein